MNLRWGYYLVCTLAVALFLDDKALYVLLYFLGSVVFVSAYLFRELASRGRFGLSVTSSRLNHGEEAELGVEIGNPSRVPVPLALVEIGLPGDMVRGSRACLTSLPSRGAQRLTFSISGAQRGIYNLVGTSVRFGDGLTGRTWALRAPPPLEIVVYPRVWSLAGLRVPSWNPYGQVRSGIPFFEDPCRVVGVRDYGPGDAPRRIHWRATARLGVLQVKEYQPTMSLDTMVLLDLDPTDYPSAGCAEMCELAIEVAASMSHHLLAMDQQVGLATNVGRDGDGRPSETVLRPARGVAQELRILDLLARVQAEPGCDFANGLRPGRTGAQPGATIIVVAPGERSDLLDGCVTMQRAGYRVLFVVIGGTEANLLAAERSGVAVWQLFSIGDLQRLAG